MNEDLAFLQGCENGEETERFCRKVWQPVEIKERESKVR